MQADAPKTRIQKRNRAAILEAALDVFSTHGFRGATVDQIAKAAELSKPNLLYYFPSKEAIHAALLEGLLDTWLDPLRDIDAEGDPVQELLAYVQRKLDMSKRLPRESRLFANEVVQGAPHILETIAGPLRDLVDEKARLIDGWAKAGKIAPVAAHHLLFSIWATTQHYADFDAQVRGILQPEGNAHFEQAEAFLTQMYRAVLTRSDLEHAP